MAAGIFGYLGYDMVRQMEELPQPNPDPIGIPDAVLIRPTIVVVFDAVKDAITVVTPVRPDSATTADVALTRAGERLSAIVDALDAPLTHAPPNVKVGPLTVWPSSNTTPAEYERIVGAAKEYIAAGDISVVLAQRPSAVELPPLRSTGRCGGSTRHPSSISSTAATRSRAQARDPARARGTVTIRPLAGTARAAPPRTRRSKPSSGRPEGACRAPDAARPRPQRRRPRRAHCTVKVTDQFFIERFSQVMHIVSNVEGQLDQKYDALMHWRRLPRRFDLRRAQGSRDGDHRRARREAQALCRGGRLFLRRRRARQLYRRAAPSRTAPCVQAGAGIVAVQPEVEQQECVDKAKALFRAAEEAKRFASAARQGGEMSDHHDHHHEPKWKNDGVRVILGNSLDSTPRRRRAWTARPRSMPPASARRRSGPGP
jgi:anthranilate synthase component 1